MAVTRLQEIAAPSQTRSASLRIEQPTEQVPGGQVPAERAGGRQSFSDMVKEFAADVNDLQFQAGHAIDQFVTGEAADVHQVMVAVEQAGIAMDLMLEIRNRVLEGYQELIRMQV